MTERKNRENDEQRRNLDDEVAFKADVPARDRDDVEIGDGSTVTAVRDDIVAVDEPVREGLGNAVTNTEARRAE